MALLVVALVALDQLTKALAVEHLPLGQRLSYAGDLFRLQHVKNPGAFLGLGGTLPEAWRGALFTALGALITLLALVVALRRATSARVAAASALVAGGGIGNVWDRIATGGWVTDFMNVGVGPLRSGIFNVADVALVAGVVVLVWPAPRREAAQGPA